MQFTFRTKFFSKNAKAEPTFYLYIHAKYSFKSCLDLFWKPAELLIQKVIASLSIGKSNHKLSDY